MGNEYKYHVGENGIYRIHVEEDDDPWNPRVDMDGNIGTMFCVSSRYNLGDHMDYSDMAGMKKAILKELNIPVQRVFKHLKKEEGRLSLSYNKSEQEWELFAMDGRTGKRGVIDSASDLSMLEDTIFEEIPMEAIIKLAGNRLIILPLYLYDHSGISISTGDFGDRWDSGQIGYIWTTLKRYKEITLKKEPAKELIPLIINELTAEVNLYDKYLNYDCYGYITEKYLGDGAFDDDESWEEDETCWGYYCETNDPLTEISKEEFGEYFVDELPVDVRSNPLKVPAGSGLAGYSSPALASGIQ